MTGSAVIAYVHGGTVRAEFMASVLAEVLSPGSPVTAVDETGSGPNISRARNTLCQRFLDDEAGAEWLWMTDTDMVFAPGALSRLIAAADPAERPVVGALCYSQHPDTREPVPVMYELADRDGPVFVPYRTWPEDACVPVAATGAACLLVHRRALERIREVTGEPAAPWFREAVAGGQLIGEDLTFCLRAAAAGIPVHVHTGVQCGHMKPSMLGKVT